MFIPPLIADTNIFVAAGFNRRSSSHRIITAIVQGRLLQVWNQETRQETLAVIDRIPPLDADFASTLFREEGFFPGPTLPEEFTLIEDKSDRKFAALARACGVILITNDSDFLEVREALDIIALRPSEFLSPRNF